MTNGDKIQELFPNAQIDIGELSIYVWLDHGDATEFTDEWWNAEYEEPTTKNDLALIHTEGLDEGIRCAMCTNYMKSDRGCDGSCVVNEDMYKAVMDAIEKRIQPTTKNDLGVENDLVSSIVEKISEKATETREEFIFETIRPYCENVVQMKISKRDLERALLKYYGKNNLGVDWESYKDIDGNSLDDLILEVLQNNFDCGNTYGYKVADEIISLLPPVTPQEPRKGHWITKRTIMHDGEFYCDVCDNDAPFNKTFHFCPNCGAKMVEPQESEGKE